MGDTGTIGPRMEEHEFLQLQRDLEVPLEINDNESHEGKQIRNAIIEKFF